MTTPKKILLVEDDGILAMFLKGLLQKRGYDVLPPAAEGEEAVERALTLGPDLILMDISLLGEMNGVTAAELILLKADIPIIYMSSYNQTAILEKAKYTAPYGYLIKPVGEKELLAMVETTLHKHELDRRLRESDARFKDVTNHAPVLLWMTDPAGRMIFANRAYLLRTVQDNPTEIASPAGSILPDDHSRWQSVFTEAHASQKGYQLEFRMKRPDGGHTWIMETAVPRLSANGQFLGLVGSGVDVSAHRAMEKAYKNQRDFAMQVMNTMGQGLTVTNMEGRFEYVNPAYAQMLGLPPEEILGKRPIDVTAPAAQAVIELQHAERKTGKRGTYESALARADGGIVPVTITSVPRAESGQYTGAIAVITDLTEHKQIQKQVQDMAQRFQILLETASDGIHVLDDQGRVVEVNHAFCRMLGYSRDELLQMRISDWDILRTDEKELLQEIAFLLHSETCFETQHRRKDGTIRDVEISTSFLELEGRRYLYGSARDITERKQTELELRRTREALVEANARLEEALAREQNLSRFDALTFIYNQRYSLELARQIFADARRTNRRLTVIMADIDLFKQVNDTYGHQAGDQVLAQLAEALRLVVRNTDIVGRYGGDEFIILLQDVCADEVEALVERLRLAVAQIRVPAGTEAIQISLSIGAADLPDDAGGMTLEMLIHQADLALLQAKQTGRSKAIFVHPG